MSEESGNEGRERPVRGMVQEISDEAEEVVEDASPGNGRSSSSNTDRVGSFTFSSSFDGSTSRSGNGGLSSGLEFVNRSRSNRHNALIISSPTTTRHRALSLLRLATISHSNCVCCIICKISANRLYVGDFCVQNRVYLLCGDGCGLGPGNRASALISSESWYIDNSCTDECTVPY